MPPQRRVGCCQRNPRESGSINAPLYPGSGRCFSRPSIRRRQLGGAFVTPWHIGPYRSAFEHISGATVSPIRGW
jgi:hypothetical protein